MAKICGQQLPKSGWQRRVVLDNEHFQSTPESLSEAVHEPRKSFRFRGTRSCCVASHSNSICRNVCACVAVCHYLGHHLYACATNEVLGRGRRPELVASLKCSDCRSLLRLPMFGNGREQPLFRKKQTKEKQCFLFFLSFFYFETLSCLIFFSSTGFFEVCLLWMSFFLFLQNTIALRPIPSVATRFLQHFRCGMGVHVWKKAKVPRSSSARGIHCRAPHKRTLIVSVRRCGVRRYPRVSRVGPRSASRSSERIAELQNVSQIGDVSVIVKINVSWRKPLPNAWC